jgi:hypothetical protein
LLEVWGRLPRVAGSADRVVGELIALEKLAFVSHLRHQRERTRARPSGADFFFRISAATATRRREARRSALPGGCKPASSLHLGNARSTGLRFWTR